MLQADTFQGVVKKLKYRLFYFHPHFCFKAPCCLSIFLKGLLEKNSRHLDSYTFSSFPAISLRYAPYAFFESPFARCKRCLRSIQPWL